jgi:hypothetical protein
MFSMVEKLVNRPLEPFFQKNQRINAVVECPDLLRDVSRPRIRHRPLDTFLSEKLEDREKNSGTAISNLFFQKNSRINAVVECPDIRRDVSRPRIRHRPLEPFFQKNQRINAVVECPDIRRDVSRPRIRHRPLEPFLSEKHEDRVAHPGLFRI